MATQLNGLSKRQRAHLMHALRPAFGLDRVWEVIDGAVRSKPPCPACQSEHSYRHGFTRGLQRYRCRTCDKTFTRLSSTPLARLRHRGKWLHYPGQMLDVKSIRAAAKAIDVHRNTSFRWRHRFLVLTKHDRPERLEGIAEADEVFLLESQKGARNLNRPMFMAFPLQSS